MREIGDGALVALEVRFEKIGRDFNSDGAWDASSRDSSSLQHSHRELWPVARPKHLLAVRSEQSQMIHLHGIAITIRQAPHQGVNAKKKNWPESHNIPLTLAIR